MDFKDYYQILQVEPHANQDDIKRAYRRLAQKFHPDINQDEGAEDRFKEIQDAYEVLKDPQKRAYYNDRCKMIRPYTYDWLYAKLEGWWYRYAQAKAKREATARVYAQSRQRPRFPLFLLGSGIFILLATLISYIMTLPDEPTVQNRLATDKEAVVTAILQGDSEAIEKIKNLPLELQTGVFQNTGVVRAIINFYINQRKNDVIGELKGFMPLIQEDFFKKDEISKRLLMAHYYQQIDEHVALDNFTVAFQLLDTLKSYMSDLPGFETQYATVQTQKTERLASLIADYKKCLTPAGSSLLEKTACFAKNRQLIAHIEPEHPILNQPELGTLYAKATEQALAEKAYERAEKLIGAWQTLLPQQSDQQQFLQQTLTQQRQVDKLLTALASGDHYKIAENLGYLKSANRALQEKILQAPHIRENLLNFHMQELLALMQISNKPLQPYLQLVQQFDPKAVPLAWIPAPPAPVVTNEVDKAEAAPTDTVKALLQECDKHYQVRRLTQGKQTAVTCYQAVLKRDPENSEALAGLQRIEHILLMWIEKALRENDWEEANYYLRSLEETNPHLKVVADLKPRFPRKTEPQTEKKPVPKSETPRPPKRAPTVPVQQKSKSFPTQMVKQKPAVAPPVEPVPAQTIVLNQDVPPCEHCTCSDLLRQLSIGVRPLTASQQAFLQTQCH